MRRPGLLWLLLVLLPACIQPPSTPTPVPVHLILAGPAEMEPLGQALAEAYMARRPYATVTYRPGDWESGPAAVARQTADVGLWAGLPTDGEINCGPGLTATLIARDAVAVVVAPHNPVVSLSVREIQSLFAGRIPNWHEVGGHDQEVQVISWYEEARIHQLFAGLVMRGRRITPTALVVSSDAGVQALIAEWPEAIGYMHWQALSSPVRALAIGGIPPTAQNIGTGQYPLSWPVVLVTADPPGREALDLVSFVRSPAGQGVVVRWLAPVP